MGPRTEGGASSPIRLPSGGFRNDEARRLVEEGYEPEAVGEELEAPKTLVFVPAERLELIAAEQSCQHESSAGREGACKVHFVKPPSNGRGR